MGFKEFSNTVKGVVDLLSAIVGMDGKVVRVVIEPGNGSKKRRKQAGSKAAVSKSTKPNGEPKGRDGGKDVIGAIYGVTGRVFDSGARFLSIRDHQAREIVSGLYGDDGYVVVMIRPNSSRSADFYVELGPIRDGKTLFLSYSEKSGWRVTSMKRQTTRMLMQVGGDHRIYVEALRLLDRSL